ncbi:MAG: hypothetical protein WC387_02640 [Candidatus Paceibacterota bacterium]|jgi:hypothetical protein
MEMGKQPEEDHFGHEMVDIVAMGVGAMISLLVSEVLLAVAVAVFCSVFRGLVS